MMRALRKNSPPLQQEKTIEEVCLSLDGKRVVFLFGNGDGFTVSRGVFPEDDGSPITHMEILDHGCAVVIHQSSGSTYDLPWDSIRHFAKGGKLRSSRFGSRLRTLRKSVHLTQAQVAWRTRLSRPHINRIEQDRCSPTIETLEKLSKAYGLTLAQVVSR